MLKKFLIGTFFALALMVASTAFASYDFGPTTLKVGSTGDYVKTLQTFVGATADGNFGPMTKAKVVAWQASNGLVADGLFGNLSKAKANEAGSGFPAGCTSSTGFSSITGVSCSTVVPVTGFAPTGCTSASGFSPVTGGACYAISGTLPAGCTTTAGYSPTTGAKCDGGTTPTPGTIGVGTVDTYTLISSINNEEVGEGLNDVKVYGLDIEVGDGSDISLTAVKLVFDESDTDTTSNFKDYADEVSVWLGSTKVGTVDSDKFTDDNAWTYTVGLSNAKILAGTTGKLYVAVSGINNLDSGDATDDWTLDVTSVRWVDGQGAMISEDPTVSARTFSFELSAVATSTEFKISEDVASVNTAHVVDIHATETTNDIPVLSFKVKIEGTGDVTLKDLPVNYTVGGAQNHVDEMVEGLTLYMDGTEVSSVNMTTDCIEDGTGCASVGTAETYTFHDIDTVLTAGETYHFLVKADIYGITDTGDVAAGDTILAVFGETQTDAITAGTGGSTGFDAEDESGTNLVDADKTGTATAEAITVYDVGFTLNSITKKLGVPQSAGYSADDSGIFTFEFTLEAFGGSVDIDKTCVENGEDAPDMGIEYTISNSGSNATTCDFTSTADTSTADSDAWTLLDGIPEVFTLVVSVGTLSSGQQLDKVYLDTINWDDNIEDTSPDLYFTAGLGVDATSTNSILLTGV